MQCFQCGSEQSGGNAFCTKCGARLAGATVPEPRPNEPDDKLAISNSAKEEEEKILRELKEALKGVNTDKAEGEPQTDRRTSNASKKFIVAGVVAILVLTGVIGLELVRRRQGTPTPPPPPIETVLRPPDVTPTVDSATRTTVGRISAILEAIGQYQKTKKGLPAALTSLNRALAKPEESQDGWGQSILYMVDLTNKTFVIRSAGPDGKRDTSDDISVNSDGSEAWLKEKEPLIAEWRSENAEEARLMAAGPSSTDPKKLEAARKLEEEKKKQEAEAQAAAHSRDQEQKRLESARMEEEKRKQAEAKREEEARQAKIREESLRQQQTARRAETVHDNFIGPLDQWDAPGTWEIVKDKDISALRVQGLGFLKKGQQWDNYKVEFEIKVNKESAGWVLRAQNSSNFYLFKLGSEKAKAIPKNSLVKYIRLDAQYLNSLKREDAPGAAGVTPLSIKVRNKDYYKVTVTVRGNTITHYIDGIQVDAWNDDTFNHGRFGFNASAIEQATIRNLVVEPLR